MESCATNFLVCTTCPTAVLDLTIPHHHFHLRCHHHHHHHHHHHLQLPGMHTMFYCSASRLYFKVSSTLSSPWFDLLQTVLQCFARLSLNPLRISYGLEPHFCGFLVVFIPIFDSFYFHLQSLYRLSLLITSF